MLDFFRQNDHFFDLKYFFKKNIKKQLQKQKIVIQYKYPRMKSGGK